MPARDGTGPGGMGTRSGRGMGNCVSGNADLSRSAFNENAPGWGRWFWNLTLGRAFRRRGSRRGISRSIRS